MGIFWDLIEDVVVIWVIWDTNDYNGDIVGFNEANPIYIYIYVYVCHHLAVDNMDMIGFNP